MILYYIILGFVLYSILYYVIQRVKFNEVYLHALDNTFYYNDVKEYEDKMLSLTYYLENGYNTYNYYKNELSDQIYVGTRIYINNVNHILNIHFKKLLEYFIIKYISENNNNFIKLLNNNENNKYKIINKQNNVYGYNNYEFTIITRFNNEYYKNIKYKCENKKIINKIIELNNNTKNIDKLIKIYNSKEQIKFNTVVNYINHITYLISNLEFDLSRSLRKILFKDCIYILYIENEIRHNDVKLLKQNINTLYDYILY